MKGLFREFWPLFAVVALTLVLALQIPRKALFFQAAEVSPRTFSAPRPPAPTGSTST